MHGARRRARGPAEVLDEERFLQRSPDDGLGAEGKMAVRPGRLVVRHRRDVLENRSDDLLLHPRGGGRVEEDLRVPKRDREPAGTRTHDRSSGRVVPEVETEAGFLCCREALPHPGERLLVQPPLLDGDGDQRARTRREELVLAPGRSDADEAPLPGSPLAMERQSLEVDVEDGRSRRWRAAVQDAGGAGHRGERHPARLGDGDACAGSTPSDLEVTLVPVRRDLLDGVEVVELEPPGEGRLSRASMGRGRSCHP